MRSILLVRPYWGIPDLRENIIFNKVVWILVKNHKPCLLRFLQPLCLTLSCQGYLFSPHYGGKQLFEVSPQGSENGGKAKNPPPQGPKYGGEILSENRCKTLFLDIVERNFYMKTGPPQAEIFYTSQPASLSKIHIFRHSEPSRHTISQIFRMRRLFAP